VLSCARLLQCYRSATRHHSLTAEHWWRATNRLFRAAWLLLCAAAVRPSLALTAHYSQTEHATLLLLPSGFFERNPVLDLPEGNGSNATAHCHVAKL
jgi:hypothetical protein